MIGAALTIAFAKGEAALMKGDVALAKGAAAKGDGINFFRSVGLGVSALYSGFGTGTAIFIASLIFEGRSYNDLGTARALNSPNLIIPAFSTFLTGLTIGLKGYTTPLPILVFK